MTRVVVSTGRAPAPVGPYSQAIKAAGVLYVSGQIAIDPATGELVLSDIEAETRQVLENLKAVVEAGGSSLRDVVRTTVFLADMDNFGRVNEVYARYFSEEPPARACVEAARLPKDVNVEIQCVALAKG